MSSLTRVPFEVSVRSVTLPTSSTSKFCTVMYSRPQHRRPSQCTTTPVGPNGAGGPAAGRTTKRVVYRAYSPRERLSVVYRKLPISVPKCTVRTKLLLCKGLLLHVQLLLSKQRNETCTVFFFCSKLYRMVSFNT